MKRPKKPPTFVERAKPAFHPEDREIEESGKEDAAAHGLAILAAAEADTYLRRLVLTYADADAHDALDAIREWFWAYPVEKP